MLTPNFFWAVVAVAFGSGFQHGYNTGVVNPPEEVIYEWIKKSSPNHSKKVQITLWTLIVSLFCFGGVIGGMLSSCMSNNLGRKKSLMFNNILVMIAAGLMVSAKYFDTVYLLIVGRFVIGMNAGLNSAIAPTYLNEISPVNIRGVIGSIYQLVITVAILLSQVLGIRSVLGNEEYWPILFGIIIFPAFFQMIALLYIAESPRYLMYNKRDIEKVLKSVRKLYREEHVTWMLLEIKRDVEEARTIHKYNLKSMFRLRKLKSPLLIVSTLMVAQQFSGINTVVYYSTDLFYQDVFFTERTSQYSTIGAGTTNVVATIVPLFLIERLGRKPLLLIGFGGMVIASVMLFVTSFFVTRYGEAKYVAVAIIYIYVIFFAVGAGAIPWLIAPELFTTGARPLAVSITVAVNWLTNLIIGCGFPALHGTLGPAVLLIFLIFQVLSFFIVWIFVPETKNRPVEETTPLFE